MGSTLADFADGYFSSAVTQLYLEIIHFGVFVNDSYAPSMERIGGLSPERQRDRRAFLRLLRRVRIDAKLTQSQLAKILGVTQARISKYEQGERRIDMLELKRICDAIHLPL